MAKSEKPANPKRKGTLHNDFFIQQWSDLKVAQAFFKEYLPASIQVIMDWSQLRLAPGDFVQKALKNRKNDHETHRLPRTLPSFSLGHLAFV